MTSYHGAGGVTPIRHDAAVACCTVDRHSIINRSLKRFHILTLTARSTYATDQQSYSDRGFWASGVEKRRNRVDSWDVFYVLFKMFITLVNEWVLWKRYKILLGLHGKVQFWRKVGRFLAHPDGRTIPRVYVAYLWRLYRFAEGVTHYLKLLLRSSILTRGKSYWEIRSVLQSKKEFAAGRFMHTSN